MKTRACVLHAQEDLRISTDKISKLKLDLDDLQRTEPKDRDARFFPGNSVARNFQRWIQAWLVLTGLR